MSIFPKEYREKMRTTTYAGHMLGLDDRYQEPGITAKTNRTAYLGGINDVIRYWNRCIFNRRMAARFIRRLK